MYAEAIRENVVIIEKKRRRIAELLQVLNDLGDHYRTREYIGDEEQSAPETDGPGLFI